MTTSVNDIRVAPIGEDLTTEDLSLSVLRGLEKMHRVDKKIKVPGTQFLKGEWAVLTADGCERAGASSAAATYLVWCGTDRFDSKANNQLTLILDFGQLVKTSRFDKDGVDYEVGDFLTVKTRLAGESDVTKAGAGDHKFGKVLEVADGYLVFQTLSGDSVAV
jgi:hypothetical protein